MNPSPKPDSAGVIVYPPIIFVACLLGGVALALWSHWAIPLLPSTTCRVFGLVATAAGATFSLLGIKQFIDLGVAVQPDRPASMLVAKGAYRSTRNPMYVGLVFTLAGLGLAADSVPMVLSALPMFFFLDWYVIPREEKYLLRTFGEAYRTYCQKVRRWL